MIKLSPRRWLHLAIVLDIVGILIITVSLLFPFHFFLPPWTHRDASLEVEAHKTLYIECDFFTEGVVRGMILTLGEGKRDIDLYIEDSSGQSVLAREGIEERYFFEFHPQNTGLYRLVLDNKMDTPRSVYVIVWQYYYNILFSCLGLGVLICGLALIVTAPSQATLPSIPDIVPVVARLLSQDKRATPTPSCQSQVRSEQKVFANPDSLEYFWKAVSQGLAVKELHNRSQGENS